MLRSCIRKYGPEPTAKQHESGFIRIRNISKTIKNVGLVTLSTAGCPDLVSKYRRIYNPRRTHRICKPTQHTEKYKGAGETPTKIYYGENLTMGITL